MIRALCIALNHREAISHVAAGVRSILSAQNEPTQSTPSRSGARTRRSDVVETTISPIPDEEIPALIIVVMVMVGLARSVDAKQMGKSEIEDECDKAMGMLHGENDVVEKFGLDTEVLNEHVESLAERAKKQWMDMEWFNNVEASTEVDDKDGEEDVDMLDVAEHEEDDLIPAPPSRTTPKASKKRKRGDDAAEPFLQPGLGTMFCDAVDWLSEDRRAKYQVWKRDILAQIEGAA